MNNSLLKGTTWYWRQGLRNLPIHGRGDWGDACRTKELYMPVKDEEHGLVIMNELKQNGIDVDLKITHSPYDVVPAGSLIVFAALSQETSIPSEEENIKKLKNYITANGGKISEASKKISAIRKFFHNLFVER